MVWQKVEQPGLQRVRRGAPRGVLDRKDPRKKGEKLQMEEERIVQESVGKKPTVLEAVRFAANHSSLPCGGEEGCTLQAKSYQATVSGRILGNSSTSVFLILGYES